MLFTGGMPELGSSQCRALACMLGRPVPDQERVQHHISQLYVMIPCWIIALLTLLHGGSIQKYRDRVLNDVTQQGQPSQQTSADPARHPQIQNVTTSLMPGFNSLGRILNRDDNIPFAQHFAPMTHGSSTGGTKDILPRPIAFHGSLKKTIVPPFPPTVPTPLLTHQVPNHRSQNLTQGITPKQITPSLTRTTSMTSQNEPPELSTSTVGVKRRLGMGQGTVGYVNKKFKPPTWTTSYTMNGACQMYSTLTAILYIN